MDIWQWTNMHACTWMDKLGYIIATQETFINDREVINYDPHYFCFSADTYCRYYIMYLHLHGHLYRCMHHVIITPWAHNQILIPKTFIFLRRNLLFFCWGHQVIELILISWSKSQVSYFRTVYSMGMYIWEIPTYLNQIVYF